MLEIPGLAGAIHGILTVYYTMYLAPPDNDPIPFAGTDS
jgi:hypothetical protein